METKHTPGPWSITESATHITVRNMEGDAVFHDEKRLDGVIEDARLIAAAPELLEALEGLLHALPSATTHPAIQAAKAAIAKAKG